MIVISANACWNIFNFRAGFVRALSERGYRVVVPAPDDEYRPKLADLSFALWVTCPCAPGP